jgi:hypothetical protein
MTDELFPMIDQFLRRPDANEEPTTAQAFINAIDRLLKEPHNSEAMILDLGERKRALLDVLNRQAPRPPGLTAGME